MKIIYYFERNYYEINYSNGKLIIVEMWYDGSMQEERRDRINFQFNSSTSY